MSFLPVAIDVISHAFVEHIHEFLGVVLSHDDKVNIRCEQLMHLNIPGENLIESPVLLFSVHKPEYLLVLLLRLLRDFWLIHDQQIRFDVASVQIHRLLGSFHGDTIDMSHVTLARRRKETVHCTTQK